MTSNSGDPILSEPIPSAPTIPGRALNPIIRAQAISKQFGSEIVVHDVSFDVPKGTIFGFIGPSGSGKTTTIRILTGFYAPTSGEALVFDRPPAKFRQSMRERIGYMPQLFVLYPHLSVWENLNFAASIYGMSFFRREKLQNMLDFVELGEHRHKLARDISGGMQRRLALAATLVHEPDLIFLDEPTAGIDPVLRQKFWDHFRELRAMGRTLLITTQYVGEAAYCDLVGVMSEGTLIAVDTPDGLRYRAYGGEIVDLQTTDGQGYRFEQALHQLPFVTGSVTRRTETKYRIIVDEASTAMPAILDWCRGQNISIESIEEHMPPFDDVFVELVKGKSSDV